ncbi:MAG: cytochrome-c peroxidase [Chromatiales bacterium 21-64-14]|nr:MAG: cytochrome-c peroxidase [Chromatiales bacterium 21-64-14]
MAKRTGHIGAACAVALAICGPAALAAPLGLPPVPIPADNPQTPEKIKLGDRLFHDKRFSSTGQVACANCHKAELVFTDGLKVSQGIHGLKGTRNAPTVVNAAYMKTLFWDGREPDLEGQSQQPFVNPVEMGLKDHRPILKIVRTDPAYAAAFQRVFGKSGEEITMTEVAQAIASFERTLVSGDSPFDRYYYGGDRHAMTPAQIRGLEVFVNQGRCVSCHTIEQTQALFTDNRFHNIGIGFKRIRGKENRLAEQFITAKRGGANVDVTVLTSKDMSEMGRFAVTENLTQIGAFKTPTLRNVARTAPYMHDGSLKTLKEVVDFYNNGGRLRESDPVDDFQSGGIRPLNLSKRQKADLVAFLEALTSPQYVKRVPGPAASRKPAAH